ncbi:MAG: cob(I)yrinic acid a,c-diamide adenosyltransferase [Anaerolineae bacterium]|nr:cob(I)yrinic acid a,c-diamide adenosyltransferase [Anaerolineae bacterium]
MQEEGLGLVHVYTGDGKGKTTAALGLALRAAGHGLRTYIAQFMKGQDYGELEAVKRLSPLITIEQFGQASFVHVKQATAEDVALAHAGLERVRQALHSGQYDIVVMDEINVALFFELLTVDEVLSLIENRPPGVELVLTGRRVPEKLIAHADLVTEMREIKHPYQKGIKARRGIEY